VNQLEALYQVQELDTSISELRSREEKHAGKKELEELEQKDVEMADGIEDASASLQRLLKDQRGMEDRVRALEEKLSREESKLYDGKVTNQKELRGLEAEVRSLKKKKDELETELLEEMERQDADKAEFEEMQSRRKRLQAEIEEKRAVLEGDIAEIMAEVAELENKRSELRSQLDEELLELYDGLLKSKHNLAVVKVIDGVCQGCRVELPGIEYDRFLKSDGVFTCTNCGRILMK
jgi:uncharacterized protein